MQLSFRCISWTETQLLTSLKGTATEACIRTAFRMAVTLLLLHYQAKKAGGGKSRRRDSPGSAWLSWQKTFIHETVQSALHVFPKLYDEYDKSSPSYCVLIIHQF